MTVPSWLRLTPGLLAATCWLYPSLPSHADEGQWTPDQIAALAPELAARGLERTTSEMWNPDNGGLMRAAVNLNGCSASFVSNQGLVITNHHCAYSALQRQSSVEHDYITDGFLASDLEHELEARQTTVRVLEEITDVTATIKTAAAAAGEDDRARHLAIETSRKQLLKTCEQSHPGHRCSIASFDAGSVYRQMRYLELRDVRLVYAPPAAIGEFGGEVDNWMWPRHTGDFSILRAYVGPDGKPADFARENRPYQPDTWLKISHEGVAPGDFVAVMGYPGHTDRHLPLAEVLRKVSQVLPARVDLYGEWIEILTTLGDADPAVAIKVAAKKKSLANRHKNARGMLAGIQRMQLLKKKQQLDTQLRAWVAKPANQAYADVLEKLMRISHDAARTHDRVLLLSHISQGPNLLATAIDLVRRARAQKLPDLERDMAYMDRSADKLRGKLLRRVRNFDPGVDSELLASLIVRAGKLPKDQKIAAFAPWLPKTRGESGRAEVAGKLRPMFEASSLADENHVLALFTAADPDAIAQSRDPLIDLALALADALETEKIASQTKAGRYARLGPRYFAMLRAQSESPHYPDANGTLRLSYATVQGYQPQEGLVALPQTTVSGQVAKHSGQKPFDLPVNVREAAPSAAKTIWADPGLGDVPLCFLANADTTGGNSGSPVVDAKGRLIGLNFDRVWENISGDFGYTTQQSRNITVDIRYMLWLLDRVVGADALLAELGMADARLLPPRETATNPATPALPESSQPAMPTSEQQGCDCTSTPMGAWSSLWIVLALGLRRRRPNGPYFRNPSGRNMPVQR